MVVLVMTVALTNITHVDWIVTKGCSVESVLIKTPKCLQHTLQIQLA